MTPTMEIQIEERDGVTIVHLMGDIDANSAPLVQNQVLPLAQVAPKILLNMIGVPYMSSAGLRMLLHLYRQVSAQTGKVVLVGLAKEIRETMEVTGFLKLFTTCETIDSGLGALRS